MSIINLQQPPGPPDHVVQLVSAFTTYASNKRTEAAAGKQKQAPDGWGAGGTELGTQCSQADHSPHPRICPVLKLSSAESPLKSYANRLQTESRLLQEL